MSGGGDPEGRAQLEADNQRLRAELAELRATLEAERELRRAVIDCAPDFIVHCAIDGRIHFVNRVVPGRRFEDAVGAPVTMYAPPEYADTILAAIARVVATGEHAELESVAPGPHGKPTHFHTRIAPVREAGGQITSVVMFASDIDQLRSAEAAARDRDTRLRLVLEASQVAICEVDLETGTIIDADARYREISELGDDPLPLPLARSLALAHPEDLPRLLEIIESLRTTGSYRVLEFRMFRSSGAMRWLRGTGKLRTDVPGTRFVAGLEDITDQKALEAQVAQAQKLESIGRLAGGVAHDFNNLLTVVMGAASLVERSLDRNSPARDEIAEIHRAAERGAALTGQLLAFARRQVIEPRVVSLTSLVTDIVRLLTRVLGEDIEIATLCEAKGRVRVDPHQIERVLVNLATNARDAMPRGGRLTIETGDVELDSIYVARHAEMVSGPYVMLAVTDTGEGMPPEAIEHVFEPFYTTKGFDQGTGLGLATCYGIVRQAEGFIQVYSEVGHGTTFRIYLPRVEGESKRRAVPPAPLAATGTETVLVVEDEPAIRRIVVRALRDVGYHVLEATDAEDALRIADTVPDRIDMLITDVVMPGIGGRELAERFATARPDAAVLFVSGYTRNAIVHHGVLDEGIEFLQKPFGPAELQARVRRILSARKR